MLFYGENLKIAYVGKITSLKQIKKLSQAGDWDQGAPFYEKGGYIIEGTYRGTLHYIRLFIPKINYDSTNKLVGYSYEWQQFIPEQCPSHPPYYLPLTAATDIFRLRR